MGTANYLASKRKTPLQITKKDVRERSFHSARHKANLFLNHYKVCVLYLLELQWEQTFSGQVFDLKQCYFVCT